LGIFSTRNLVRRFCYELVDDVRFQALTLAAILGSCATLAVKTSHDSPLKEMWLSKLNYLWVAAFSAESVIRIIATSLVQSFHNQLYPFLARVWYILELKPL
jgi:hypothetical protein